MTWKTWVSKPVQGGSRSASVCVRPKCPKWIPANSVMSFDHIKKNWFWERSTCSIDWPYTYLPVCPMSIYYATIQDYPHMSLRLVFNVYVYIYIYTCIYIYIYMYIYICIFSYVIIYLSIYIYICIFSYVIIYLSIYIYKHTCLSQYPLIAVHASSLDPSCYPSTSCATNCKAEPLSLQHGVDTVSHVGRKYHLGFSIVLPVLNPRGMVWFPIPPKG